MRALVEFLARFVEPNVSFRFLLALVFAGLFVQSLIATVLSLRDLARPRADTSARERQLVRLARRYALLLALRMLSWRSFREHGFLFVQIVLLAGAAVALNWYVYTWPA